MKRRVAVLLATVLLALAACGGSTSRTGFSTDGRVVLRTYTALVEQHLSAVLTALSITAATQDAASGRWSRVRPALEQVSRRVDTLAAVWFVRPDGSYYTVDSGLQTANLSDRDYFPRLMSGADVDGDLVVSKSTGKRSCIVAAPIRVGGAVVGGLGASIDATKLSALVDRSMALPPHMVFYAIDARGRTALHIESANIFDFPSDMGSPSLGTAVRQMLGSPSGTVTYRYKGAKRTVLYMRSSLTGWVFALGRVG